MDGTVRGGVYLCEAFAEIPVLVGATKVIELRDTSVYLCSPSDQIVPGIVCVNVTARSELLSFNLSFGAEVPTMVIKVDGSFT